MLDKVFHTLSDAPTTVIRVLSTLFFVSLVMIRYVLSDTWVPADTVLWFLAASLGLDTAHFYSKRRTYRSDGSSEETEVSTGKRLVESQATTDQAGRG